MDQNKEALGDLNETKNEAVVDLKIDQPDAEASEAIIDEGLEAAAVPKNRFWFEKLPFYLLLAVVFLAPLIFSASVPLVLLKTSFVAIVTTIIFILWAVSSLKSGVFFWPSFKKNPFILSSVVLAAIVTISSLFSGAISQSFLGATFEVGTGISIVFGVVLFLFTSRILRTKEQIFALYIAFFSSALLLGLFQILRTVFGPGLLSFGTFTTLPSIPLGKWNEMAIFFGLTAILTVITLETFKLSKIAKWIAVFALVVSLFMVALVNFIYVTVVLGLFSLAACLYYFFSGPGLPETPSDAPEGSGSSKHKIAVVSLSVLVFSLLFIGMNFWGNSIRAGLPANLNPVSIEVSPSFSHTLTIAKNTMKSATPQSLFVRALLGAGPNRFVSQWLQAKPLEVNSTIFWNNDFTAGVGLVSTFLVTGGIIGFLAWVAFLLLFLWLGYKKIFAGSKMRSISTRYLTVSSFFAALYLWIFNVIYVPTGALFALTFIFTGVFIASLYEEGEMVIRPIKYASNKKIGFLTIFILIIAIIAAVSLIYVGVEKLIAAEYFSKGVNLANNNGDLTEVTADIQKAASLDGQASYYRTLVDLDMNSINTIVSQKGVAQNTLQSQFQSAWANLMADASKAMKADPTDYQNYLLYGNIYQSVIPLGYQNAYQNASAYLSAAAKLNPTDPLIPLSQAQLELQYNGGNTSSTASLSAATVTTAEGYIGAALKLKSNYTDAMYLLAQIQVSQGDPNDAIQTVLAVAQIDPSDPTVFFQLGYLEYSVKNYPAAIQALDQAVTLESDYSNARYFLGLSDYQTGKVSDAISQFSAVLKLNPDNQDVANILSNLRAGRAPISNETPASDQAAASQTLKNTPSSGSGKASI